MKKINIDRVNIAIQLSFKCLTGILFAFYIKTWYNLPVRTFKTLYETISYTGGM